VTIRRLLWTGRLVAVIAVIAMLLTLTFGLRMISVEGARGDTILALQAAMDELSSRADDLALNGATAVDMADFLDRARDLRGAILQLPSEPQVQRAATDQLDELERLLTGMVGAGGRIATGSVIDPDYRADLDALASAGRLLDVTVLRLLQDQKASILDRVWGAAVAVAAIGLSLLAFIAVVMAMLDRSIVGPIGRLTVVVDRIGAGDMAARVSDTGTNELGTLGRHINAMADERAARETAMHEALAREATLNAALCRTQTIGQLGGWHADLAAGSLTWDRQTCTIFGFDPQDDHGPMNRFLDVIDPRDRDRVVDLRRRQMADGDHIDFQHRIVTAQGIRWVWQRAEVVVDDGGLPTALDGTVQDITTMKYIELELQSAREEAERGAALLRIAGRTARIGGWRHKAGQERVEWTPETASIHDEAPGTAPTIEEKLAYLSGDDRCRLSQRLDDCLYDGIEFNEVLRLRTAKGREIWVRVTGEAVRDADGAITEIRGACQDITDLIAARSEADRRNAELVGVVSSMDDGFVMLDEDGKVSFFNDRARALFRLQPAIREGTDLSAIVASAAKGTVQGGLSAILKRKKPCRSVVLDEATESWIEVAVQSVDGCKVIIARDVSTARQAQRRLLLLDAALEEINDIVTIVEVDRSDPAADMTVLYANSALRRITGVGIEDFMNRPPRARYPEDNEIQRAELDRLDAAARARQSAAAELFVYRQDGTQVWLQVQLFPLDDPNTNRSYIVSIERDVTAQKLNEEHAFHTAKMEAIGHLTGGVAHDFNNLLTVILGNADMLYETIEDDEKRRRVGALIDAAERGARLTDSMLAFSRRTPLRPARTDINQLIDQSHGLLQQAVRENIQLTMALGAEQPIAEVDGSRLQAAIVNLVLNSRDAIDGHGHITLATSNVELAPEDIEGNPDASPGQFVLIIVSDDGAGITPNVMPMVFEPFFTTKPAGAGTGLGLSTVYGFAKQTGGYVRIYSEPGLGTTVRLYLPCARGTAAVRKPDADPAGLPEGKGEHVLVVEDDPALLDYVVTQLNRLHYRVTAVGDADAALDVLTRDGDGISLLFTDVVLPGEMHGGQLAEKARAMLPDLRVLFTSGYTRSALDRQGRIDPSVQLLGKPYRLVELARNLRTALEA